MPESPGPLTSSYQQELQALLIDLPEVAAAVERQREGGGVEHVNINLPPNELAKLNSRVLWTLVSTVGALTDAVDRLAAKLDE